MRNVRIVVVTVSVCCVVGVLTLLMSHRGRADAKQPSSSVRTEHVVVRDLQAALSAYSDALSSGARSVNDVRTPVTVSSISAMHSIGARRLASRFSGQALQNAMVALANAERMNTSGTFRSGPGSVDHLVVDQVTETSATRVSLKGSLVNHSTVFVKDGRQNWRMSRPSNRLMFTANLVFQTGVWKVDEYDWEFAPGSAP